MEGVLNESEWWVLDISSGVVTTENGIVLDISTVDHMLLPVLPELNGCMVLEGDL